MIKLIKNEIFKILHKRGTYIVLIITALFITLVSYLIGHEETYFSTETYFDVDTGDITQNKINKEMNEKYQKYDTDTWQHYVIDDTYDIVSAYYYAKESGEVSEEIVSAYQEVNNALANDDWKYFVNKSLSAKPSSIALFAFIQVSASIR